MSEKGTSRRALLGAAVGLSFDTPVRQAHRLLRMSGEEVGSRHCEERSDAAIQCGDQVSSGLLRSARNDDTAWHKALAAFEAAAGELRAFEAACRGRPFEEQEALQGQYDARGDAMDSALLRLLRAPAPDVAALAVKIGLAIDHEIGTLSGGEACLASIRRDAVRLAAG